MDWTDSLFNSELEKTITLNMLEEQQTLLDKARVCRDLWEHHIGWDKEEKYKPYFPLNDYGYFTGFNTNGYIVSAYGVYMQLCHPHSYDTRWDRDEQGLKQAYKYLKQKFKLEREFLSELHSAGSKYEDVRVWGRCFGVDDIGAMLNIYGVLAGGLRNNFDEGDKEEKE